MNVGVGNIIADYTLVSLVFLAGVSAFWSWTNPKHDGFWHWAFLMMAFGWMIYCVRLGYSLLAHGDIFISELSLIGQLIIAGGQILGPTIAAIRKYSHHPQ